MNRFPGRYLWTRILIAGAILVALKMAPSSAQTQTLKEKAGQENNHMTQKATGPFEVKMVPQKPDSEIADAKIARFTGDKVYHGDLEATGKVAMLAVGDPRSSAGYVAMERVTGSLKGRKGSFALQHSGTMTRGTPALSVTVVPDSGTDELKGLSGKMNIIIAPDGKHSYEFAYTVD